MTPTDFILVALTSILVTSLTITVLLKLAISTIDVEQKKLSPKVTLKAKRNDHEAQ